MPFLGPLTVMYPFEKRIEMLNSSKVEKKGPDFYMNFNISFSLFGPLKILHFFPIPKQNKNSGHTLDLTLL